VDSHGLSCFETGSTHRPFRVQNGRNRKTDSSATAVNAIVALGFLVPPCPQPYPARMDPTESPATFALMFILLFVAIWTFVLWIASRASGWRRMAQRFGGPGPFASVGERVRFASAQIGWANYGGALDLRVSASGVYLATVWVFRPFHPPLFVPWAEIEVQPTRGPGVAPWLTFRSVPGVRIRFSKRAFALLQRYI